VSNNLKIIAAIVAMFMAPLLAVCLVALTHIRSPEIRSVISVVLGIGCLMLWSWLICLIEKWRKR
jgi:hypothetical protein